MCCDPDAHYRGFGFPDLETLFPRVDLASPHREMPFGGVCQVVESQIRHIQHILLSGNTNRFFS